MLKVTCLGILAIITQTLADINEVACCPPDSFLSLTKVPNRAVCYTLDSKETTPVSVNCDSNFVRFYYKHFVFHENGQVDIVQSDTESTHKSVQNIYCVHNMHSVKENVTKKYGIVCTDTPKVDYNGYVMLVSVAFLILTFVVYTVLSELRDLQGKSYMNLCASLAIGLCLLAVLKIQSRDFVRGGFCAAKGFFTYYFLVASFFWTTAIAIQLLLSIRSPSSVLSHGWKTFGWYALFAWGCPTLLTISMAIVNYLPGDHAKPGIGLHTCWFEVLHDKQRGYWLYSVMGTLISINFLIFIYISVYLYRNNFSSTQVSSYRYRFFMAVKLFIAMGLYWIFEIISTFSGDDFIIWAIIDVLTGLQGVWIFLVLVVFRKRVMRAMHQRGWLTCISGPVEKYLANDDEADANIVDHTTVPMEDH